MSATVEIIGQTADLTADNNAGISKDYVVTGVTSADSAVIATRDFLISVLGSPPSIGPLVLDQISCTEDELNIFRCTASWKTFARRARPATGESQFSFELGLEPTRVRHAVGGIQVYKKSGVKDWKPELLNDQGDGQIPEGVDIYEPTYEESKTVWGPTEALTDQYRNTIKRLVGCTNNAPFMGWATGEVLLKGVSGTRRGADDSELTFRWGVRHNQTDLEVEGVTGIGKQGWQYLWPRTQMVRQTNGPAASQVTHVCVATVFRSGNFADLNIGV